MQVTCDGATTYRSMKLLSVDPANYQDAPTEGIRRVLEQETGRAFPRSELVDTSQITSIRMGTTVRPSLHDWHLRLMPIAPRNAAWSAAATSVVNSDILGRVMRHVASLQRACPTGHRVGGVKYHI